MSSLADTAGELYNKTPRRVRCSVAVLLDSLDERDCEAVTAAINSTDVRASDISDWLAKHGHSISSYTVQRHRKRGSGDGCRCPL